MRTLTIALAMVGGLMAGALATGASAASAPAAELLAAPATPGAAAVQQVQYPGRWPYWEYPRYRHHDWPRWEDRYRHRWRYSDAEQLNMQELNRLGVAP